MRTAPFDFNQIQSIDEEGDENALCSRFESAARFAVQSSADGYTGVMPPFGYQYSTVDACSWICEDASTRRDRVEEGTIRQCGRPHMKMCPQPLGI